jgi:hypothetical protein
MERNQDNRSTEPRRLARFFDLSLGLMREEPIPNGYVAAPHVTTILDIDHPETEETLP